MNDTEQAFFRYFCSENDGMVSLVETDSENVQHYEDRECETLEGIEWWST